MDLMAQRYADPYLILNDFIRCGQFHEFSVEVIQMITNEKNRESRWEYFLHVATCEEEHKMPEDATIQKEEALEIINASNSILESLTL